MFRESAGGATKREDTVLAAQPLWCSQGLFVLGNRELSRKLRSLRLQQHNVQP
jgi:hypothetical protein